MTNSKILTFLNQGDVSIQYQVGLYLTELSRPELSELKSRIAVEGFGKRLLSFRDSASRMWEMESILQNGFLLITLCLNF